MGFSGRFLAGLVAWVALILVTGSALLLSLQAPGLGAVRIVAGLACVGAIAGLWRHVSRTNRQLARFLTAVRHGDLSQSFAGRGEGSGFAEIGQALNDAIRKLREERHELSDAQRFYEAVLDDAPTALLVIDEQGRVELGNKAARRLLIRHRGVRVEDFRDYGETFANTLRDSSVGRPRLVPLVVDGVPQTAMVSAAVVHRLGRLVRVVAVQPIQTELNAVEIAAQSDLIRVLTHEIMNSMTPITSLAHTAAELVAEAASGDGRELADACAAVEALARRADGVMHFVETYRQISRAPRIRPRRFPVAPWAEEVARLFDASDLPAEVALSVTVIPRELTIEADPDLLLQVLLNLLRNGAEAAASANQRPTVALAFSAARGGQVAIEVADNGPGVPASLRQDVFLPFFTTKEKGTGIGLSLVRQIVLAHQGSISLDERTGGGACFRLII
jgi:nitrogen fixation/metabolism regulation signal transduction histidine kinase